MNNVLNVLFCIHFRALVVRSNFPAAGESKVIRSFLILPLAPVLYVLFHPGELNNNYEMFYMTSLCVAAREDEKEA